MPTPSELKRFQANPAAFRDAIRIPIGGSGRFFGSAMADFQRRDFAAMDPAFVALSRGVKPERISRFWIERTKGASKDTDLAALVLWLVAFSPLSLTIQVAAAKQAQADELRKALRDILRLNPWLSQMVVVQADSIINLRESGGQKRSTGTHADIITADAAGSHGARPHLLILNELTHIADREFCATLMDNASKVPHGVVVIATNAGHTGTWQEEWRKAALESDRWYLSAYTQPAPWLDQAEMIEAKRRNPPARYARLWEGQWGSDESGALQEDDITSAIKLLGRVTEPEKGWVYFAGLDLGLVRDSSALAVVGLHVGHEEAAKAQDKPKRDDAIETLIDLGLIDVASSDQSPSSCWHAGDGRLRLADLRIWKPSPGANVQVSAIEAAIFSLHQRFGLACLAFDPHQAIDLSQRISRAGIRVEKVDQTTTNLKAMAAETLNAFSEHNIELFGDEQLLKDLRSLKAKEMNYGVRLVSERGPDGHGDSVTALAIALVAARRCGRLASRLNRPLTCYALDF